MEIAVSSSFNGNSLIIPAKSSRLKNTTSLWLFIDLKIFWSIIVWILVSLSDSSSLVSVRYFNPLNLRSSIINFNGTKVFGSK